MNFVLAGVRSVWVILIISGLITIEVGFKRLYPEYISSSWPSVNGRVIQASLRLNDVPFKHSYTPLIDYRYEVNGVEFNQREALKDSFINLDKDETSLVVKGYAKGATVAVFYQPDSPENSTLIPGIMVKTVFIITIGGLFTVVSFLRLQRINREQKERYKDR